MRLADFSLERYFAKYEMTIKYLLSSSDCDGLNQSELLAWADDETSRLWNTLRLGYTDSLGNPVLREEIRGLYETVSVDDVLVLAPEEGIFLAMHAILEPGDHVVCTWPGYQSLYSVAESLGCEISRWEPDETAGWRFDVSRLRELIKPTTRLLVCNFPHNPTGALLPREDLLQLVSLAQKQQMFFFSDEMYRFLELRPADRLPSVSDLYDRGVSLSGMSKTFGMGGARIGWVVTKDRSVYGRMAALRDYTTICSSAPSEVLSIIALRARERILKRHMDRLQRNLQVAEAFFREHANQFSWVPPQAGTVCFPRLLSQVNSSDFCDDVRQRLEVMLLPSTVYGYGDQHFRLGLGRENMPEVLGLLDRYLRERS